MLLNSLAGRIQLKIIWVTLIKKSVIPCCVFRIEIGEHMPVNCEMVAG